MRARHAPQHPHTPSDVLVGDEGAFLDEEDLDDLSDEDDDDDDDDDETAA